MKKDVLFQNGEGDILFFRYNITIIVNTGQISLLQISEKFVLKQKWLSFPLPDATRFMHITFTQYIIHGTVEL